MAVWCLCRAGAQAPHRRGASWVQGPQHTYHKFSGHRSVLLVYCPPSRRLRGGLCALLCYDLIHTKAHASSTAPPCPQTSPWAQRLWELQIEGSQQLNCSVLIPESTLSCTPWWPGSHVGPHLLRTHPAGPARPGPRPLLPAAAPGASCIMHTQRRAWGAGQVHRAVEGCQRRFAVRAGEGIGARWGMAQRQ